MAKTGDWYLRVLGMRVGPNPDFKFPVCWLYLGDNDVVHITEGVEFKQRQVSDQGLYQLFMFDPNGIKIELNFSNAEAGGMRPELMASELPS